MPITRSFTNAFEVVDYTQELQIVPNTYTLLGDMGIFSNEYGSTATVTFEETNQTLSVVGDIPWNSKPQAMQDDVRKVRSYAIPHFAVVDALHPSDINAVRGYGKQDAADTEAEAVARKIAKIRKSFDMTKEVARFKTITTGRAYAPRGTVVADYFADYGITQKTVDFNLAVAGTDVMSKVEEVIAHIQDNAFSGDVITSVVGLASPEFFSAFIAHPKVQTAYQYYSSTQEIQRNRAGGAGLYREFAYGGLILREVRGSLAGERLVAPKECHFIPTGTDDVFKIYHAPANRFGIVNTIAEEAYLWTFKDQKGTAIDIEAETNFLTAVRKPQLIVKGFIA